MLLSFRTK